MSFHGRIRKTFRSTSPSNTGPPIPSVPLAVIHSTTTSASTAPVTYSLRVIGPILSAARFTSAAMFSRGTVTFRFRKIRK